jgi:hypothetical protein
MVFNNVVLICPVYVGFKIAVITMKVHLLDYHLFVYAV